VAALTAALLDGTIAVSSDLEEMLSVSAMNAPPSSSKLGSQDEPPRTDYPPPVARSSSIALGPCPCVGAALRLRSSASMVLGDDLIARLSPQSISRLRARVRKLLPGGGGGDSQGQLSRVARLGGAWVGDAFGSTVYNLRQRPRSSDAVREAARLASDRASGSSGVTRERQDGGEESRVDQLQCPGVVYLMKPRAGGGMTVATCNKGGLSEALLWQLHDALISKSMLAHHSLAAYIRALDQI